MVLQTLRRWGAAWVWTCRERIEQISGDRLSPSINGTLYPALLKLEQEGPLPRMGYSDNIAGQVLQPNQNGGQATRTSDTGWQTGRRRIVARFYPF